MSSNASARYSSRTADPRSSGVSIERRSLLWLPVAAVGGQIALGKPSRESREEPAVERAFTKLTREELGERWQALARELLQAPAAHDESYAGQLAGLIARVPIDALPRLEKERSEGGVTAGPSWLLLPCLTVEFRMEPGAVLKPHNHPPQVVVTLCAEGEVSYRHFEVGADAPPCTQVDGQEFRVRETRAGILSAGRTTALTRLRDGIHGFVAGPRGARLIDFTLSLTDDIETFSYVKVSAEPEEREARTYRAGWLGKER